MALLCPQLFASPLDVLLASPAEVAAARPVFQRYHLSSFASSDSTSATASGDLTVLRLDGCAYDDWVGQEERAALDTAEAAKARFTLLVPEFLPANRVVVRLDDDVVFLPR